MSGPDANKWVIMRMYKSIRRRGTNRKEYVIASLTNDPRGTKGDAIVRLRKIIEEDLGWRAAAPCLNGCGERVTYSVLDSIEVSDGGVICSGCGSGISGYLRYDTRGPYGILFQEAVLLVAMVGAGKTDFHVGSAVALAFTALEVFLMDVCEFQQEDKGIEAGLDPMTFNVWKYLGWLEAADLIGEKEAESRKVLNELKDVRNDFAHRGKGVDVESAVTACEGIAKIFNELGHLLPPGVSCLGKMECFDEA